jgi:flagellar hook assembly protein FlgD
MVFRNSDGSLEGKDDDCMDILVEDLNTATPTVTNSDGTPFSGVTVEWVDPVGVEDISASFNSIKAYPNPVSSTTTIRYALNKSLDNLEINVMDALGRTVSNLYSGSQSSGTHTVAWNASNVNSGVYFYTFSNGESVVTKKLMVVK